MVIYMVTESAKKRNYFLPKGGVSDIYSPRAILPQEPLDYEKHCGIPFGSYCQAADEMTPKNSQKPRTLDCIYLRCSDHKQGGHDVLDLGTGAVKTRPRVSKIPVTKAVLEVVHTMADRQNMPRGLKILTRTKQVLYDSSLIAGVDYVADHSNQEDVNEDATVNSDSKTVCDNEEANDDNHIEEDQSEIDIDPDDESEVQEQSNQSEVEVSDNESGQEDHPQLDDITQSNVLPQPDEDATRRSTRPRVPATHMNIAA